MAMIQASRQTAWMVVELTALTIAPQKARNAWIL
jgi:hypothetical protein